MRLAVYTDYPYRRHDGAIHAERAFVLFLSELARHVDHMVLLGRLDTRPGPGERSHYRVADGVDFVALPHYESLADPRGVIRGLTGAVRAFWRSLADVDGVWLLGPHPLCLVFAGLAGLRGRKVFLGVRQDLPRYARARHPRRRTYHVIADLLEASYRLASRRVPTIVVGPEIAHGYRHARRLLTLNVSLVHAADLPDPNDLPQHEWGHEPLRILSVGRLDTEKNPLLMADVLALLDRASDGRDWRLVVCGEGPLQDDLADRVRELGVADRAELRGYVPVDRGLLELYRDCHALLHVSWTEGVPQVLFEAFANGLPAVATDVGGVRAVAGDDVLLIPPGDAKAAAAALERIATEPELRERLRADGLRRARDLTIEAECARVAAFMG